MGHKSYQKKLHHFVEEAQKEVLSLAEEVVHVLKEFPPQPLEADTVLSMIERWEAIETISAALQVCLQIHHEHQPERLRQLRGQLKYWRRAQSSENIAGWIELRMINGSGPYLYHRWREPGSRRIHTNYYGRADWLLNQLALERAQRLDACEK